jgi:hypothetical protein
MRDRRIADLADRVSPTECEVCGHLVLAGATEYGPVALDIWVIPWREAAIIERYGQTLGDGRILLWRIYTPGKVMPWHGLNRKSEALLVHRCGNRWWLNCSDYVKGAQCELSELTQA